MGGRGHHAGNLSQMRHVPESEIGGMFRACGIVTSPSSRKLFRRGQAPSPQEVFTPAAISSKGPTWPPKVRNEGGDNNTKATDSRSRVEGIFAWYMGILMKLIKPIRLRKS